MIYYVTQKRNYRYIYTMLGATSETDFALGREICKASMILIRI